MILGVIGQVQTPPAGTAVYPGALAALDFVLGVYELAEAAVAVSDLIDKTDTIGPSGLFIDWNNHLDAPDGTAALMAVFNSWDWTIVFHVVEDDTNQMYPFYLKAGADKFYFNTQSASVGIYDQPQPTPTYNREAVVSGVTARPASKHIAATRTNSRLSLSVNGSAVVSDTLSSITSGTVTAVLLGNDVETATPFMHGYIERLIVYPAVSDAALPAYSA